MKNKTKLLFDEMIGRCRVLEHELEDGKIEKRWVANDVAVALGYKNIKQAIKLNVSEKNKILLSVASEVLQDNTSHKSSKARKTQRMNTINIVGVIELINNSGLKNAKQFVDHINGHVIPSLIENGLYVEGMEEHENGSEEQVNLVIEAAEEYAFRKLGKKMDINIKNHFKDILKAEGVILNFIDEKGISRNHNKYAILEDEMINLVVLGKRAKEIRKERNCKITRDALTCEELIMVHARLNQLYALVVGCKTFVEFMYKVEEFDRIVGTENPYVCRMKCVS